MIANFARLIAWQNWMWSRQPNRALEVAQRLPREYLHDVWFTGPRAVLTARAHELAGQPEDAAALFWKAWALSRLGDKRSAEAASNLLQQRMTTRLR